MSDLALLPESKKISLVELDIGQQQTVWFNWSALSWYVDFDAVYDLIDASLLAGISAQTVGAVGSISSDGAQLLSVGDAATVQQTELSFFYDAAANRIYVHLQNGDEPALHRVILGVVIGLANHAGIYNGTIYEGLLRSAPAITKSRDPLFFGRIIFGGGTITIDNDDGCFDRIGEDLDLFGNAVRIRQGFNDQFYSEFIRIGDGLIENVRIGPEKIEIDMVDKRKGLSRKIPIRTFELATYPNLKTGNAGKLIPLAYGSLYNVPIICTNEAQSPAPATYTFKICDCADHAAGIKAIDAVYVNGVVKTPASTDFLNGEFTLAAANYSPGQKVTANIRGYVDGSGNMIQNAADVILDLLNIYLGIAYISAAFDLVEWAIAKIAALNVGLWLDDTKEIYEAIEDTCASSLLWLIVHDDGRFTLRTYNPNRAVSQTLTPEDLLEVPTVDYDTTEVLTSTIVEYALDWDEDKPRQLHDISQQAAVFAKYKTYRERTFPTLLTSSVDAQIFSTAILAISGAVQRKLTVKLKTQAIRREVTDFIEVPIVRQSRTGFLGTAKVEILGIRKDLLAAGAELACRIIELYPNTVYVQGEYWGDGFWGDMHWSRTLKEAV